MNDYNDKNKKSPRYDSPNKIHVTNPCDKFM